MRKNNLIEEYDTHLEKWCAEQKITYIKISHQFDQNKDVFAKDGLHPNDSGHEKIYTAVKPELLRLIN